MIYAQYNCLPGRRHPDIERVGEAHVSCWLRVRSFAKAKELARRNFSRERWTILALEELWRIPPGHYRKKDKGRRYYEQAMTDREVYLFHLTPRYPVYCVDFEAVATRSNKHYPANTHADVKYWVVNEKVSAKSDVYDGFWDKVAHKRKAIALGRRTIRSERWRVTAVRGGRPLSYRSFAKDSLLTRYYEEAEEYGECVAFWTYKKPNRVSTSR